MDKILIRQHLNTLSLVMNRIQTDIDDLALLAELRKLNKIELEDGEENYLYVLKESLCDLDTMRQEYQKELDK